MDGPEDVNGRLYRIQRDLTEAINNLRMFSTIISSHMNDFVISDVLEKTREERDMLSSNDMVLDKYTKCCYYYNTTGGDGKCHVYCHRRRREQEQKECLNSKQKMNTFLSVKKEHEINGLSGILKDIVDGGHTLNIVDFGSGKGYLGQHLTAMFGYNVVGVEMNVGCASSADKRKDQLKAVHHHNNVSYDGYKTVNYSIDSNSVERSCEFVRLIKENISNSSGDDRGNKESFVLTGLHACGDLTTSAIKIFIKEKCFDSLCIVGCCYNLISETGFPISQTVKDNEVQLDKSAKMLACQCPVKWDETHQVLNKSLLYRAILQKILVDKKIKSEDISKMRFRRLSKKELSFEKYMEAVRKQCEPLHQNLTIEEQDIYYNTYASLWPFMVDFHRLRMKLAPIIENIILLDRLCFLLENGFEEAGVVRIFDPTISPRCYAVVCKRLP